MMHTVSVEQQLTNLLYSAAARLAFWNRLPGHTALNQENGKGEGHGRRGLERQPMNVRWYATVDATFQCFSQRGSESTFRFLPARQEHAATRQMPSSPAHPLRQRSCRGSTRVGAGCAARLTFCAFPRAAQERGPPERGTTWSSKSRRWPFRPQTSPGS